MDVAEWIDGGGAAAWRATAGDDLLGGYARLIPDARRSIEHDELVPHYGDGTTS